MAAGTVIRTDADRDRIAAALAAHARTGVAPDPDALPPADDACHLVVLALTIGERLVVEGGELHLTLPGGPRRVPVEYLDELEHLRGWVRLVGEDAAEVTDAGRYWLDKWMRRKLGPGVVVTSARVRRAA